MRTGDQTYIKELNTSIVLNLLRTHATISRTEIAKKSGLNKATITSIIDDLLKASLVEEVGTGPSSVGRRPVLLHFHADAGVVIGCEIGIGEVRAVMTNLSGDVLGRWHEFTKDDRPETHMLWIERIVSHAQNHANLTPLGLLGVGVGVPGLVNYKKGTVLNAPNLRWEHIDFAAMLQERLVTPVYVDNEANAAALGETLVNPEESMDQETLVYVSVGNGIGAGLIMNNRVLRGAEGLSGEIGHMMIEENGRLCSCGSYGCLEMYASVRRLLQAYESRVSQRVTVEKYVQRLDEQDPVALQVLEEMGHFLGIGVANIINMYNPSYVILGNQVTQFGVVFLEIVRKTIRQRCFVGSYSSVDLRFSKLGEDSCAIGAANLVLRRFFARPT
nr:ROK family protein [Bacilli bacterium]